MRLKLFCRHKLKVTGINRGENLLGNSMWAVYFQCSLCLKRKLDKGYNSEKSAQQAADKYKEMIGL